MLTLIDRAAAFGSRTAVVSTGRDYTYQELLDRSARIAAALLAGTTDLEEERIAFLVPPGFDYVAIQWGIWRAGGIAVPLCTKYPTPSLRYAIEDTAARTVLYTERFTEKLAPLFSDLPADFVRAEDYGKEPTTLPDLAPPAGP